MEYNFDLIVNFMISIYFTKFLILSPKICANSLALLLIIADPIILPAFVLSMEMFTKASSPNLVFVYKFDTKKTDSSSTIFKSEGTTNFNLNCCFNVSIISLNELKIN